MTIKKPKQQIFKLLLCIFCFTLTAIVIESCKKDIGQQQRSINSDPEIEKAKNWYELNYPNSVDNNLNTQSITDKNDLSHYVKPDWQNGLSYSRFNKDVIELPIDPSSKYNAALKNITSNQVTNKAYSRSSFILINNGNTYDAYVMTLIADSAYLKNDISKLARNTYNKRDTDYSGLVLYFTPKGKYVSGWRYKNGRAVLPNNQTNANDTKIQSINTSKLKPQYVECYDYYLVGYTNGVEDSREYLFTLCSGGDGGSGSTGGGGTGGASGGSGTISGGSGTGGTSSPTPPLPCTGPFPKTKSTGDLIINRVPPDPVDPGDGTGFPPPQTDPCTVAVTEPKIILDSLTKHFPCVTKLVLDNLFAIKSYDDLVAPFETSLKPDLIFTTKNLQWNPNGGGHTELGNTGQDNSGGLGLGAIVTLNNQMLLNSSKLMIASTAIHESLHAYINYNVMINVANNNPNFKFNGSWINELDFFYDQNALPPNYRDHYEIMTDYFDKAVSILGTFDNSAHTTKEYAMAMLFGLNTPDANATAIEKSRLNDEFNELKLKYNITDTDLNTFYRAQLNSTTDKLPGGC